MKRILLPLTLLIVAVVLYGGYKLLAPQPLTDVEMEMLVESAGSTQYLTAVQRQDNNRLFADIKQLVESNQNRDRDLQVLATAEEIKKMSEDILKQSAQIRSNAIASVGSTPEKITNRGRMVSINDEDLLKLIFAVKSFNDTVSVIAEKELSSVLVSPENEKLESFDFFQYYFKDKSLAMFLLNLSRMENDLVNLEREAIESVGQIANYVDITFDKLVPLVNVENKVVENGATYEAEITFGAIDPNARQVMTVDNRAIQSQNGIGKLILSPEYFKSRRGDQSIRGAVTLETPFGNTTYGIEHNFSVKR